MRTEDRFFSKVEIDPNSGCWLWTGKPIAGGYGIFRVGPDTKMAHRHSWEMHNGPIPSGLLACHKCDTPPCVNPSHLFLGTDADNSADKIAKGRDRPLLGEENGRAKLSAVAAEAIRAEYSIGLTSQQKLADRYGVTQKSISNVVRMRNWTNADRPSPRADY